MIIARVTALPEDLPQLAALARAEGFRMLDVLAREWADGTMRFTGPDEALFSARDASDLLGIGGITRDPFAPALRMRRFYVRPDARGRGIGRALAEAAIGAARSLDPIRLRAPASAAAFWASLGFLPVAGDPDATHARPPAAP